MAFKIYTKTGDKGQTSLFGGKRLPKHHLRIEAYGTVDELNANLGLLRDHLSSETFRAELKSIQNLLFSLGSMLATDPEKNLPVPALKDTDIVSLEQAMDRMDESLPPLRNFILPGGHPVVSYAHLARCVCRRAERLVVALHEEEPVDSLSLQYLNRLSDYLFVLARAIAHDLGVEEVTWQGRPS